jgi:hypothetical protein
MPTGLDRVHPRMAGASTNKLGDNDVHAILLGHIDSSSCNACAGIVSSRSHFKNVSCRCRFAVVFVVSTSCRFVSGNLYHLPLVDFPPRNAPLGDSRSGRQHALLPLALLDEWLATSTPHNCYDRFGGVAILSLCGLAGISNNTLEGQLED